MAPVETTPTSDGDGGVAESQEGVLLYYKYTDVTSLAGGREGLRTWYEMSCLELGLVGRVRVAKDGVNATLGGSLQSLRRHCDQMEAKGFEGIDFKLDRSHGALNERTRAESGFDRLRVQETDEVVSLGPRAAGILAKEGAPHLSPEDFHRELSDAKEGEVVLVDVRNVYESRIGKFQCEGVKTLVPETRTFAQFPRWADTRERELRGKRIMMYCTGGVRCEKASAFIKSMGDGFENVVQLKGGIQRYLESFPEGGHYKGKNFVFDSRSSVSPRLVRPEDCTVGRCAGCGVPCDSYGLRARCGRCRLLLLLCEPCARDETLDTRALCEACCAEARVTSDGAPQDPQTKVRILCLHGFRQTARSFGGRTAKLRKRLRGTAELIYIDGPYLLAGGTRRAWSSEADGAELDPELGLEGLQTEGQGPLAIGIALVERELTRGPFLGILAFSEGAAVVEAALSGGGLRCLRFVILASGFVDGNAGHDSIPLELPSLHIFGGDKDRQVPHQRSEALADRFASRKILRHEGGHFIPSSKSYVADILAWIRETLSKTRGGL